MKNILMTAIITGGTSGIGLATAKIFLSKDFNCVLVGRSEEKFLKEMERLKGEKVESESAIYFSPFHLSTFPPKIKFISADVGKVSDCEKVLQETLKNFGGANVLVNCAGIYLEGAITSVTENDFDKIFSTNVKGTFFMSKVFAPELCKTKGAIVNVASDAGLKGNYFCAAYSASKGAVIAFTKSLALELASFPVRVNCVAPGDILTPLTENQLKISGENISDLAKFYPLGRIGKAEEVAQAIYFLASDNASFITGEILKVDGGLTA